MKLTRKKRRHHIGEKYIVTMILLVAVFFSAIEIFTYHNTESIVSDLYEEMALQQVAYADSMLGSAIKKMETTMRAPLYNTTFLTAVRLHRRYATEDIQSQLQQMIFDNNHIMRVCLYDTADILWHAGEASNTLIPRMEYSEILESDWGRITYEANGLEVFFGGDVLDTVHNEQTGVISCCKLMRDPENGEPLGVMIATLDKSFLSSSFIEASVGDYAVMNEFTNAQIKKENCLYSTAPIDNFTGLENDRLSIVSIRNPRTGWSILSISKKSDLTERAVFMFVTQAVFLLAMGGLMFICFTAISRNISKPIKRLYGMVVDFEKGIYRTDEVFDNDEIGDIGNKFVEIMKENEDLTENYVQAKLREQEASFRFLQAQINPHFIYNVLDSIYWMSRLKTHASNVAEMAISLSRILRYSVNKNDEHHTTVEKELQLIQHYLQIQNIRYQGKFRVMLEVDDDIMDCPIIKFLLEPFVENAIVHGLEGKPGDGHLKIVGINLGDELEFQIIDDGIGVDDPDVFYSGYGIKNVSERIRRCYVSDNAGITFTSSPETGTTVVIRVSKEIAL